MARLMGEPLLASSSSLGRPVGAPRVINSKYLFPVDLSSFSWYLGCLLTPCTNICRIHNIQHQHHKHCTHILYTVHTYPYTCIHTHTHTHTRVDTLPPPSPTPPHCAGCSAHLYVLVHTSKCASLQTKKSTTSADETHTPASHFVHPRCV